MFVAWASIPTTLYAVAQVRWLSVPWVPIALVGTAVAFITGFKNNASYDRVWEARQIYGAIVNSSRAWGIMVMDFVTARRAEAPTSDTDLWQAHTRLIHRHIAWLHALRFQLRAPRAWENMERPHNRDFRERHFTVPELDGPLDKELAPLLREAEVADVQKASNKATRLIALGSRDLKRLLDDGLIEDFRHMELEKLLVDLYAQQGKCERIKNFPYPRQFATANMMFVRIFLVLVPFGLLGEFARLGEALVWLNIPFSALVSWVFNTMEKIGESTENPFEGGPNDVPITAITRTIEIDLREMLGEHDVPPPLAPINDILM